jgi:hypothetical protein
VTAHLRRLVLLVVPALLLASCGGSPQPISRSGNYQLTLSTEATQYAPNQPIAAVAELVYLGTEDRVVVGNLWPGVIGFGLRQLDGTVRVDPAWHLQCLPFELRRNRTRRQSFNKSGVAGEATNASFYSSFFDDSQLRLPAGRWELYAMADLAPVGQMDCQDDITLRASTQITVR